MCCLLVSSKLWKLFLAITSGIMFENSDKFSKTFCWFTFWWSYKNEFLVISGKINYFACESKVKFFRSGKVNFAVVKNPLKLTCSMFETQSPKPSTRDRPELRIRIRSDHFWLLRYPSEQILKIVGDRSKLTLNIWRLKSCVLLFLCKVLWFYSMIFAQHPLKYKIMNC